ALYHLPSFFISQFVLKAPLEYSMMRRVANYQDGKIYEIVNLLTLVVYIGSTAVPLDRREKEHQNYSKWCNKPLYVAMRNDGQHNFAMRLVKNFPCNSRKELEAEEH